jgi:hypothetical protein
MAKRWDVFISHASEDKDSVVRPLASKLRRLGLKVWLDEAELKLGDSLSRKIDEGLAESNAGVVILSPSFFLKNWPEYELRGLTAKTMAGDGRIIPIWHNVEQHDVVQYSPTLADALAGNTRDSLDKLAMQIAGVAKPDLFRAILRKVARAELVARAETITRPASMIRQGPIRHASFPNKLVNRIDLVRYALRDVMPPSRRDWVRDFQQDTHPSGEIEVWENIAAHFVRVAMETELSESEKGAVFSALLLASLGDNDAAAKVLLGEFGEQAQSIFDLTRYESSIFTPISEEDRRRQAEINTEIEDLAGLGADIDLSYIEEIVAQQLAEERTDLSDLS